MLAAEVSRRPVSGGERWGHDVRVTDLQGQPIPSGPIETDTQASEGQGGATKTAEEAP